MKKSLLFNLCLVALLFNIFLLKPQVFATEKKVVESLIVKANKGDITSQLELFSIYIQKEKASDYEEAARWCKMAAEAGNPDAQYNLGRLYYNGHGVKQSFEKAAFWYKRAADNGNDWAMGKLGQMYFEGKGVDISYEKAFVLYRKAAEGGALWAEYLLGWCYYYGYGTNQNDELALASFKKVALAGDADAQMQLGAMYRYGQSVEADKLEAYKWYAMAAKENKVAAHHRDNILKNLSREELSFLDVQ